jgi:hypothetical protein
LVFGTHSGNIPKIDASPSANAGGHDTDEEQQQQHNGTQAVCTLVGAVAQVELAVRELVEVSTHAHNAGLPVRVQST